MSLLLPTVLFACAEADRDDLKPSVVDLKCTYSIRSALFNAQENPPDIEIGDRQIMAIGSLEDADGVTLCTGILVRSDWVLTAAHCGDEMAQWFRTGKAGLDSVSVRIMRRERNPEQDIMLLQVQQSEALKRLSIVPIGLWAEQDTTGWLGSHALLAGFGLTESGDSGERLFLSEPIVDITPTTVTVDGRGASGACTGDSGGPMILRDEQGAVRVFGVLVKGSSNCLGIDVFVRTDALAEWIISTMDEPEGSQCAVSTTTANGRCLNETAVCCGEGGVTDGSCGESFVCSLVVDAGESSSEFADNEDCTGIDYLGVCKGEVALQCKQGVLFRKECAPCNQVCVVTQEGLAICK